MRMFVLCIFLRLQVKILPGWPGNMVSRVCKLLSAVPGMLTEITV